MKIEEIVKTIKNNPLTISFGEILDVIDFHFNFIPTAFTNGQINNKAGQNNGSCKIFFFSKLHNLTKQQTLHCFGSYYRVEVLENLEGDSHQNIRSFMEYGWEGIKFDGKPLINSDRKYRN